MKEKHITYGNNMYLIQSGSINMHSIVLKLCNTSIGTAPLWSFDFGVMDLG